MTISQKQLEEMRNADPDSIMGMAHNLFELVNKHQEITGTQILVENPSNGDIHNVAEDGLPTPEPEPDTVCCYEHIRGGSCYD